MLNLKRLEFVVIYTIFSIIFSVLLWFLLDRFDYLYPIEMAVLIFLIFTTCYITYLAHGKGILPSPSNRSVHTFKDFSYERKQFKKNKYTRRNYFSNKKSNTHIKFSDKKYHYFSYKRSNYRSK